MKKIALIFAHPFLHHSKANRFLFENLAQESMLTPRDLYELYPQFQIDVAAEQRILNQSQMICLGFPIQWYSCPSLMKEWLDTVLEEGYAYGASGTALKGKDFQLLLTTGGPEVSYHPDGFHKKHLIELLSPFSQLAHLCGMNFCKPLVFFGARRRSEAELNKHLLDVRGYFSEYVSR